MVNPFFAGNTYDGGDFKGLTPKYYPKKYKDYIELETKLLKSKLRGAVSILEAGVGLGRLIPVLAPIVGEFTGIDNSDYMIQHALQTAEAYDNVSIQKADIEQLGQVYEDGCFIHSMCLWNTLGNVDDPVRALQSISQVTQESIFVTVFLKGTVSNRLDFYKHVGVTVKSYDPITEIFNLDGYTSNTFDEDDLDSIASESGLFMEEWKTLAGVMLWAELVKID